MASIHAPKHHSEASDGRHYQQNRIVKEVVMRTLGMSDKQLEETGNQKRGGALKTQARPPSISASEKRREEGIHQTR
jgi:hypothetical protein